jgi:hypothetical protein
MPEQIETHKKRSLSLTTKCNDDLEALCDHLGVNAHSYIVNTLAKAVQQDLMTYTSKTAMNEMVKQMEEMQRKLD